MNSNDLNTPIEDIEETSSWVSISDLMSGLFLIFALLVVVTMYQLKVLQEQSKNTRVIIIHALTQQFSANGINAQINQDTGDITLLDSVLFDHDKSNLKADGKDFLNKFIPVYNGVLISFPEIREEITRIIIEGHTSSAGHSAYNMSLSMSRSNSVFQYIYSMDIPSKSKFINKLEVSGRGELDSNKQENLSSDRRVIFRMQFKSDEALLEFMKDRG